TVNGGIYGFQHAVHVSSQIIVPEAHDAIAFGFKPAGPRVVALTRIVVTVLRTIHFNDQSGGHASEVCNIRSDRHLTTKMPTSHGKSAEPSPQQILCGGRGLAHSPGRVAAQGADRRAVFRHGRHLGSFRSMSPPRVTPPRTAFGGPTLPLQGRVK